MACRGGLGRGLRFSRGLQLWSASNDNPCGRGCSTAEVVQTKRAAARHAGVSEMLELTPLAPMLDLLKAVDFTIALPIPRSRTLHGEKPQRACNVQK
eukprot:6463558-Amphidinium_carterae.2